MGQLDQETLKRFAGKYIWWKTPDEAVAMPERVVAQVMNIGDYDDVQVLAHQVGDDYLRAVLGRAEIGQFSARSWAYWHYRLGLAAPGQVPPLPVRRFVRPLCVFLDFDGVLHPRGGFPLSQAERLADAIAQYPELRIVLSTSWVETYGTEQVIEMLPDGLRERAIGATYAQNEAQPESRYAQIAACVARLGIDEWLAVDDDKEGWPEAERHRLVWCDPSQGFDERAAQALHAALASISSIPYKRIR